MFTPEQYKKLLVFSGLPLDPELCLDELLHEIFEATADRLPDKIAVETPSAALTYRQLDERANRLARHLRAAGIGPEDKVAFQLPREEIVYVVMLGILKCGAAYVPLDPEYPADRTAFILEDSGAKLFITAAPIYDPMRAELAALSTPLLLIDSRNDFEQPSLRLSRAETGASRDNLAYVIYTSGTTGRPKGCLLEHRNICNEVRSIATVYGIVEADRVFQGFSVAFDASIEQIWMAFFNGCTLVVGTKEIMRSGPNLANMLTILQISVISCVPTLLSMVEKDIPTLRVIIFGGEVCPKELAARWHRPGRRLFNCYGPTETTIAATSALILPNMPITIGIAIPNYKTYIVGDDLKLLPPGESGELCIGGPGVARGYLNRDDLTSAKFVEITPWAGKNPERVYRTGDMARFAKNGDIEFLGRSDDQVKLRGYRVELSEIESVLMQCPGVLSAAVSLHEPTQRLAAYVVPRKGWEIRRAVILQTLKERLPAYMTPAWLDEMKALPMLVSGKVNRRLLPAPVAPLVDDERKITAPRNEEEARLKKLWAEIFERDDISVTDDFFTVLGGHSLLAARMVSRLRETPLYADVAMGDLYQYPTIEALTAKYAAKAADAAHEGAEQAADAPRPQFKSSTDREYFICGLKQVLLMPVIFGILAWVWLSPFIMFEILTKIYGFGLLAGVGAALILYALSMPLLLGIPLAVKWLLIGRFKPGAYPLWGNFFLKVWLLKRILHAIPLRFIVGTPALNVFYRLMGAKIGKDVFLGVCDVQTFDLLEIGDGASIGADSSVDGYWIENGEMRIGPVRIGAGCVVGCRAGISPGSSMADNSTLGDLSLLNGERRIPSLEVWAGSPAVCVGTRLPKETPRCWSAKQSAILAVLAFTLPILAELPVFPGIFASAWFNWYENAFSKYFFTVPLIAVSFILLVCLQAVLLKKYVLPRQEEGTYPLNSEIYVRNWFFGRLYQECLHIAGTVFATLYLPCWFRLLGAKLGKGAEISSACGVQPDLLQLGDNCFVADDVMLGSPTVAHGFFTTGKVHVGNRTFLGNSAVIPAGTVIGSDSLIGCLSTPPGNGQAVDGASWFGSPPILLPTRQKDACYAESLTYKPSRRMVLMRLAIEAARILLPMLLFVCTAITFLDVLRPAWETSIWLIWPMLPVGYMAGALAAFVVLLALKWTVIGRYRPGTHPLWSAYVWRAQLITGAYESFCARYWLDHLRGTPLISFMLRLLGMNVGRRCYIDSTWFTEMDLISIGDETALNEDANLQTHLFEDRIMKEGTITIGPRCSIGTKSFVLYDTRLGDEVNLDDYSLIMKGETMPPRSSWHGIPARRASRA